MTSITPRAQWASRFAFILAATGAAVGLGNIWRFSYVAGAGGGAAFVLVYLACVLFIAIPMLISEIVIGRRAQKNVVNSMHALALEAQTSPRWSWLAWMGLVTLTLILSFYCVVASWTLPYIFYAFSGQFSGLTPELASSLWLDLVTHPQTALLWMTVFLVLTLYVVMRGVKKGIERASYIMVPALLLILLVLLVYAILSGGFSASLNFLFAFKWQDLTTAVVIDGMGQAAFSLATGAGALVAYGAYLSKKSRIFGSVFVIASLDVLIALLAGVVIFAFAFAYGAAPNSGEGLLFNVLPLAFSEMQHGALLGGLFFTFLLFAAWTSAISLAEPTVDTLCERYQFSRRQAVIILGVICWVIAAMCALSFSIWSEIKFLGNRSIFQAITELATNVMLPIGGVLFAVFAGWFMHTTHTRQELVGNRYLYLAWLALTRFVVPIAIITTFAKFIFEQLT